MIFATCGLAATQDECRNIYDRLRRRSLDNMFDSISGSTNFMEVDNDG